MTRNLRKRHLILAIFLGTGLFQGLKAQQQGTGYLPKGTFASLLFDVDSFRTTQGAEYFPHEIISAIGKRDFGIDPATIASGQIVVSMGDLERNGPPLLGAILRLKEKVKFGDKFEEKGQLVRQDGVNIYFDSYLSMHIVQPDSKTILFATTQPGVLEMAKAKNTTNPFSRLLSQTKLDGNLKLIVSVESLKGFLNQTISQSPLPPPFAGVNRLPEQLQSLEFSFKPQGLGLNMDLKMVAYGEKEARQIELTVKQLLTLGKALLVSNVAAGLDPEDPVEKAQIDYMTRLANLIEKDLTPARDGSTLTLRFSNDIATVGTLTALLLPAVQAAREAARRVASSNNMKQILLAFHIHHDTYKRFPAQAITDKEGKKLLSWRVHILPFIEQQALYDAFKLDEPWNSEHNVKLLEQMPITYANPNSNETSKTNYLAVTGMGTAFEGTKGKRLFEFTDGTSNSIMMVEADQFVPWTKPVEFEVDWDNPIKGLGNIRPGIFNAGFADGSIQAISNLLDPKTLKSLFTIRGGELLNF